jgi:hypothetical protein
LQKVNVASYTAKDGAVLKVGSPLVIGVPEKNIEKKDDFPMFMGILYRMLGKIKGYKPMGKELANEKVVIEEITATSMGISKKDPRYITILVQNSRGERRFLNDYETALETGEVINPNATPTREQAIKMMKDAKELVDMGVMTQQKFDSPKVVLSPILLKN